MTRRVFTFWFFAVALLYLVFMVVAVLLKKNDPDRYATMKDLIPLATALPAAILASLYQRRSSFLLQLRSSWTLLLSAIQDAIQFTFLTEPKAPDAAKVFKGLSMATDDFRSLFKNLKEGKGEIGYFPFETLKKIIVQLGAYYAAQRFSDADRKAMRDVITNGWKIVRVPILREFDRAEPTYFDSPF